MTPAPADATPDGGSSQRLDKWLWYTRVVKSRTLAAGLVSEGKVRVNRERVTKPAHAVRPGDVITAAIGGRVRVLKVLAGGERRGPPVEARTLYEDLSPPPPPRIDGPAPFAETGQRDAGSGRPTKRERRETDRLKGR